MPITDEIVRTLLLPVSLERAWELVATPEGLSTWFCHEVKGDIQPGGTAHFLWPGDDCEVRIVAVERPHLFSYRWRPGVNGLHKPLSDGPNTLVQFALAETVSGVEVTMRETGFLAFTESEFGANTEGWDSELGHLLEAAKGAYPHAE